MSASNTPLAITPRLSPEDSDRRLIDQIAALTARLSDTRELVSMLENSDLLRKRRRVMSECRASPVGVTPRSHVPSYDASLWQPPVMRELPKFRPELIPEEDVVLRAELDTMHFYLRHARDDQWPILSVIESEYALDNHISKVAAECARVNLPARYWAMALLMRLGHLVQIRVRAELQKHPFDIPFEEMVALVQKTYFPLSQLMSGVYQFVFDGQPARRTVGDAIRAMATLQERMVRLKGRNPRATTGLTHIDLKTALGRRLPSVVQLAMYSHEFDDTSYQEYERLVLVAAAAADSEESMTTTFTKDEVGGVVKHV